MIKGKNRNLETFRQSPQQAFYNAMFERSTNPMFLVNHDGQFLEINKKMSELLEASLDKIDQTIQKLVSKKEIGQWLQESYESRGKSVSYQKVKIRMPTGTSVIAKLQLQVMDTNAILGILQPSEEAAQTAHQFYQSEERFRLLADSSLAGIYLIQDGFFKYVNQAFAEMFGYEIEEVMSSLAIKDLIYHKDHELVFENMRKRFEGETESLRYTFRGLHKDGSILFIEVHGQIIEYDGKRGVIGTLIDITETKKIEEELRLLNETLEVKIEQRTQALQNSYQELKQAHTTILRQEKLVSIGQLASGIAHEINNPVQFLNDNISFLKESFSDLRQGIQSIQELKDSIQEGTRGNETKNAIEQIIEETDLEFLLDEIPSAIESSEDGIARISKIVAAMKDYAHPSGDTLAPVDLEHLIDTTIEISRNAWKHIAHLSIEHETGAITVNGLRDELGQVLLNLITNAVDAITDAGGKDENPGSIAIKTRLTEADMAEITIEDSGCGISEEHLPHIFDPFFTTKTVGRGSGQGLAISYQIICNRHSGKLSVQSEKDKGSTFTIQLPL